MFFTPLVNGKEIREEYIVQVLVPVRIRNPELPTCNSPSFLPKRTCQISDPSSPSFPSPFLSSVRGGLQVLPFLSLRHNTPNVKTKLSGFYWFIMSLSTLSLKMPSFFLSDSFINPFRIIFKTTP